MASNLQYIKSASGSSVSTQSVTDCFSDKYDVYMVSINKLDQTAQNYLDARLIDSGGVDSTANYNYAGLEVLAGAGFAEKKNTGQTLWANLNYQGTEAYRGAGLIMYIFNPYNSSSYTYFTSHSVAHYSSSALGYKTIGVHKVNEQITGIQFLPRSGSFDNITINVFGVK
jgi:hypothetical protein